MEIGFDKTIKMKKGKKDTINEENEFINFPDCHFDKNSLRLYQLSSSLNKKINQVNLWLF